jgi:hypothetical protein
MVMVRMSGVLGTVLGIVLETVFETRRDGADVKSTGAAIGAEQIGWRYPQFMFWNISP